MDLFNSVLANHECNPFITGCFTDRAPHPRCGVSFSNSQFYRESRHNPHFDPTFSILLKNHLFIYISKFVRRKSVIDLKTAFQFSGYEVFRIIFFNSLLTNGWFLRRCGNDRFFLLHAISLVL